MAELIENQIHQYLKHQEEVRYKKEESLKGKPVKRRKISKPWTRSFSLSLCPESDLLEMVTDFDYDLSDPEFQIYCKNRIGLNHALPQSRRWDFFEKHQLTKNDYLEDPYFHYAEEYNGKRYKYTEDELHSNWRVIMLGRATIQDCWEIYKGGNI